MAFYLSKIRLNGNTYNLKDAQARTDIDHLPEWSRQSTKPTYTAAEVGALPDTYIAPVTSVNGQTGEVVITDSDEKLKTTVLTTTGVTRYLILGKSSLNASTKEYTNLLSFTNYSNTYVWLSVGKGGSTRGGLRLYTTATGGGYTDLISSSTTGKTITLPDATGTLALTSDIDYTKLQTTAGENNSEYNLIGTATSNTNTSAVSVYNPGSISFAKTTTEGRLTLGSSSLPGKIRLYSNVTNATGYTDLVSGATSTNTRTITFPDATGTVALTTDIPSVPSWAMQSSKPSYAFSELTSHPTTINDYGITDAYTKTEVDGLVSGVLHYKGTKANTSALPNSGNVIGDVWHITADGSEYAWDGSAWQELGTATDLSGYVPTSTKVNNKALSGDITLTASDVGALPSNTTYVSSFNGDTGAITYIAPVTSVNGQTGAVTVAEDDQTWNGYTLDMTNEIGSQSLSIPWLKSNTSTDKRFRMVTASSTPHQYYLVKYDINAYLYSTTPSANDNSTKVATTAYVDSIGSLKKISITQNVTSELTQTTLDSTIATQVAASPSSYYIVLNGTINISGDSSWPSAFNNINCFYSGKATYSNTIFDTYIGYIIGTFNYPRYVCIAINSAGVLGISLMKSPADEIVAVDGWSMALSGQDISILNNDAGYITANDTTTLSGIDISTFNNDAGYITTADLPADNDTTYTISISNNVITLTPSSGQAQTITLPVYNGGIS